MDKELTVLQGKIFSVELQSMLGSTNYGWCITKKPDSLIFTGSSNIKVRPGIAPVIQKFDFGAVSAEPINTEIEFAMVCLSDIRKISERFTVKVRVVPYDSGEFVDYSENATNPAIPYGFIYSSPEIKYGYPCEIEDANLKYGYPCNIQNPGLKYGYPCGVEDANLKYGYPCNIQNPGLKYGYPCGVEDANLKYGYPCNIQNPGLKYGYPCGVEDANLKYGYPCNIQNPGLKYGYPCGVEDANLKYGYPCIENSKEARPYGWPFNE